jgi:two-component system chemotaxis response regulator CheB
LKADQLSLTLLWLFSVALSVFTYSEKPTDLSLFIPKRLSNIAELIFAVAFPAIAAYHGCGGTMPGRIRVLIVDDSAIVRDVLSEGLARLEDIDVVGVAQDPFIARDKILRLKPDVITLDIEMPRMDGLTFLERLMTYYPIPVIIVSSVTTSDRQAGMKALEIGAFDVVNKPGGAISVGDIIEEIAYKIRQAYEVRDSYVARRTDFAKRFGPKRRVVPGVAKQSILRSLKTTERVLCIGSSTGGTVALEYLFHSFPASLPPLVIVQHMPPNFTKQFAERLNGLSAMTVKEAEDGEILSDGTAYIAPGGFHLIVERRGASLYTRLTVTERVHFQRPAVDVLFSSVAEVAGRNAVASLLTGMGKDGADGLLALRKAGARTIAQDENSSVVWGMPKAAIDLDAAQEILALEKIGARMVELAKEE